MYKRAEYQTITSRLEEPRRFIQVVMGPRQIGKSTVVKQVLKDLDIPYQMFSADNVPTTNSAFWVVELSTRTGLKQNYAEGLMIFDSTEPNFKNFSSLDIMFYKKHVAYKDEKQILQFDNNVPEIQFECYRNNLR